MIETPVVIGIPWSLWEGGGEFADLAQAIQREAPWNGNQHLFVLLSPGINAGPKTRRAGTPRERGSGTR